jgi:hypothetical protein
MPVKRIATFLAARKLPPRQRELLKLHNEAASITAIKDPNERVRKTAKLIVKNSSKRTRKFLRGAGIFPYAPFDVSLEGSQRTFRKYMGKQATKGGTQRFTEELESAYGDLNAVTEHLMHRPYDVSTAEALARMPNAERHIRRRYADESLVADLKQNTPDVIGNAATPLLGHIELLKRRAKKGNL